MDNVAEILAIATGAILLKYLVTTALQSKRDVETGKGSRTYGYFRSTKALVVIGFFVSVGMGAGGVALYDADETEFWVLLSICFIFTAASVYLLVEVFFVCLTVSSDGIASFSPWSGKRFFRWDEIQSIAFSKSLRWYVVVGPESKKIYIAEGINGFGVFTAEFLRRVPRNRWKHSPSSVG